MVLAVKSGHGICAAEREGVCLAQLVPELLQADRGVKFSLRTQNRYHFSEGCDRAVRPSRPFRARNDVAYHFGETHRVRPALQHELRERLGGIQQDVSAL